MKYFSSKKNFFQAAGSAILPGIIFFSLISALCPIESDAKPAKKKPVAESVKQNEKPAAGDGAEGENASAPEKAAQPAQQKKEEAPLKDFSAEDFGPKVEEESYGWTIFKLLFILGLMGGGFYYFFRFVTKRAGMNVLGRDVVNVLSIVPVGQNKFIQVVDLADRVLVLGVTDANINLITEITSRDEIDRLRLLSSKSPDTASPGFSEYLTEFVTGVVSKISDMKKSRGKKNPPEEYEKNEDYLDYLKDQKGRLKKMNGNRDE